MRRAGTETDPIGSGHCVMEVVDPQVLEEEMAEQNRPCIVKFIIRFSLRRLFRRSQRKYSGGEKFSESAQDALY